MRSSEPTQRQREVLDFIVSVVKKDLMPPTIREICEHFNWSSTNSPTDHLRLLGLKGYVDDSDVSKARGIVLTDKTRDEYNLWFRSKGDIVEVEEKGFVHVLKLNDSVISVFQGKKSDAQKVLNDVEDEYMKRNSVNIDRDILHFNMDTVSLLKGF